MDRTINGVKVIMDQHINKGVGIHIPDEDTIVFHPHDYVVVMLNSGSTYREVFDFIGVVDNSIDACITFAISKLNKSIDNYGG